MDEPEFQYDVFVSYADGDRSVVEPVARELRNRGLRVFFDYWKLIPGVHWQDALREALADSRTCAVFLGAEAAPWREEEMRVALGQWVAAEPKRVIPVLLPGAQNEAMPEFLAQRTWVDLREGLHGEAEIERLVAGILGSEPVEELSQQEIRNGDSRGSAQPQRSLNAQTSSPGRWRSRLLRLGIALGLLGAVLTTLVWIFPRDSAQPETTSLLDTPTPSQMPDLYALRVQVLDPSGRPLDGSSLRVSAGNEPLLLPDGWWQIEIPRAKAPMDGQITVWAEHPRWASAREPLRLDEDPNPQLEIRLEVPRERIAGAVVDGKGHPVTQARVSVLDHAGSSVTTGQDGRFELWVTAARDEKARLHIEHAEFSPQGGSCFVGRDGCALVLEASP